MRTCSITTLLILIAVFAGTTRLYAQNLTLNFRNEPLKSVFNEITRQSGFRFIYNSGHLAGSHNVTASISGATLKDVMDKCFKDQPFTYQIIERNIVLTPRTTTGTAEPLPTKGRSMIKGKVVDEKSNPLPGVNVTEKNTAKTTTTDNNGFYQIDVDNENAILQFSYVGYEVKEIAARNASLVMLAASISKLDEVQVIAYGTTTRRLNTGSVVTIKAKDIENQPVTNPLAALQGRVPGMIITQTSGVAGSAFKVQIRGQSSLDPNLSQNNPLFIIDGVPFESGNTATNQTYSAASNPTSISSGGLSALNTINPQDIESIDILKDADATSIYGSRGANGVIIITTKKGKPGKTTINANVSLGFSRIARSMEMLDTKSYLEVRKEAMRNDGITPSTDPANPGYAPDLLSWDTTRYTDFKRLLIGGTGYASNYKVSVSGGGSATQFIVGAGYNKQSSVYPGNFSDNVASFNTSINHESTDQKFKLSFSAIYANDHNRLPRLDLTRYINLPPNLKLYNEDGSLCWSENGVAYATVNSHTNPLAVLNEKVDSQNDNLSGSLNLSYELLPGLKARITSGYNTFTTIEKTNQPSTAIDPILNGIQLPSAYFGNQKTSSWIIEPQLEYVIKTRLGKFNFLAGNTMQNKSNIGQSLSGYDYTSDILLGSIRGAGRIDATNTNVVYRYTAFFGRINYNLNNRYIVNISARRDGSSRFSPEQRWANFGALGMAWVFSEEKFIKDVIPALSFGKLRGSYGTTGNDQIGDYKYLNLWSNAPNPYNGIPGLYPRSLYNSQYEWEINKKLELSLELGFLNDKLLGNVTFYRNRSNNQLINYKLPGHTGFTSVVQNTPALVQNKGWEFVITTKNVQQLQFNWATSFNITFPENKLLAFPGLATSSYSSRYQEGESLNLIRGFKFLYLDAQTGLYKFEDVNGDGAFTSAADYQSLGNTDPKLYGGLQNNLTYKGFDLAFFFQFSKQKGSNYLSKLVNTVPGQIYNQPAIVLDRWQQPGQQTNVQKLSATLGSPAALAYFYLANSDGALSDASFIRLKNVSLSYSFKGSWLNRINLPRLRVYVEAQNLLTLSNYKGPDPETMDFYVLPPLRTLVAGIRLNL